MIKTGNWYTNLKEDHKHFESIVNHTKTLNVKASIYQNAGANMVQQLAYTLAHTNEYLNHINNSESLQQTFDNSNNQPLIINIEVSIGSNYFFEIAKLRALRLLLNELVTEYNINTKVQLIATPSTRNKTLYDYNTNMLRTTTECMSAILGGANTINNLAYDAVYHKDNEFASRISRNQLLILKHESYFNEVNNASDGAYYIESLTKQLAEKHQIKGWVRNLMSGSVEMMATGETADLQMFIEEILSGNRFYQVDGIDIQSVDYKRFNLFEIIANG